MLLKSKALTTLAEYLKCIQKQVSNFNVNIEEPFQLT